MASEVKCLLYFLVLSAKGFLFGQQPSNKTPLKRHNWYVLLGSGITHTLKYNNEFASKMASPVASNCDFFIGRYWGSEHKSSVCFHIGGYDHYPERSKQVFLDFLNQYGDTKFGDIMLNDWSEWRLGITYTRFYSISDRWNLFGSFCPDIVLASRSAKIYFAGSDYIYAYVPKTKMGLSGSAYFGVYYLFMDKKSNSEMGLGMSYNILYGVYPAVYHIRYGTGNDPFIGYSSYAYASTFVMFRQRLMVSLKIPI